MLEESRARATLREQGVHLPPHLGVTLTGFSQEVLSPQWFLFQGCVVNLLDLPPAFAFHVLGFVTPILLYNHFGCAIRPEDRSELLSTAEHDSGAEGLNC
jgi:hypothetical protein